MFARTFVEPNNPDQDHHATQLRAYYLWQERGSPAGSSELDWMRAEQELANRSSDTTPKPAMVAVAEAVGSALGSIAGIVTSAISRTGSGEDPKPQ
jgi:hypothetical protein